MSEVKVNKISPRSGTNITLGDSGDTVDLNGIELVLDVDGDTSITADTDDQIDFKTGGTDRVTIDSSGVGIGVASPSATLDVDGTIKLDGNYPVGTNNVALGNSALDDGSLSGNNNTAIGNATLTENTSGAENVALGYNALDANTTANDNTAVGSQALTQNITGAQNTAVGKSALVNNTGSNNTAIGINSGNSITSGTKNTILGSYSGNQGGLDIRTSSNNIVLSDGDGNPRINIDSQGSMMNNNLATPHSQNTGGGAKLYGAGSGSSVVGLLSLARYQGEPLIVNRVNNDGRLIGLEGQGVTRGEIAVSGTVIQYTSYSDHRLKEDVQQISNATESLKQLNPVNFAWIDDGVRMNGFLAHEVQSVVPEAVTGTHNEVDSDENPVYQGLDQAKLVPLLVKTIQELEARITELENA